MENDFKIDEPHMIEHCEAAGGVEQPENGRIKQLVVFPDIMPCGSSVPMACL